MGVYKKNWYYETPKILNGDTTVTRRSIINDGLALDIYLNGPSSSVTTRYYDMNSGHGGSQVYPTQNPKSAIEETRLVILTTPKEHWEEKPFTFEGLRKAIYNLYDYGKKRFFTR